MNRKYYLIPAVGIAIAGGIALRPSLVRAQSNPSPMQSLIQKLAQKFNLEESDVQSVFDQDRQERLQQQETQFETRINQLVTDGKITAAQKDLIIAKHKELQANRQVKRQELETWAKQNNIDLQYLMFGGRGHGRGMGMHMNWK